jgi:hypothetical protein
MEANSRYLSGAVTTEATFTERKQISTLVNSF